MKPLSFYAPDTTLDASKNTWIEVRGIRRAAAGRAFQAHRGGRGPHCETLFAQDARVEAVTVKIIKLAIAERAEQIASSPPRAAGMKTVTVR